MEFGCAKLLNRKVKKPLLFYLSVNAPLNIFANFAIFCILEAYLANSSLVTNFKEYFLAFAGQDSD